MHCKLIIKFIITFSIFLSSSIHSFTYGQKKQEIDSLENLLQQIENNEEKISDKDMVFLYVKLANHYKVRDINKATDFAYNALKLAKNINFEKGIAHSFGVIGSLYNSTGEYDSAIIYYNNALDFYKKTNDSVYIAKMFNNIGLSHDYQGKMEIAVSYYLKSLDIKQQLKDTTGIITCLNNIGASFFYLEKYNEALKYYKMCIPLSKQVNDNEGLVMANLNIGETYRKIGQYELALEFLLKANEQNKTVKSNFLQTLIYDNIGLSYMELGNNKKAIDYLKKSIEVNLILNDKDALLNNYTAIGSFYHKTNNLTQAVDYYTKAYQISSNAGFLKPASDNAKKISQIYSQMQNYKQALHYHQIYSSLRDSVINTESNKLVNEMKIKYETEKKDNQISLLKKEKEISDIKIKNSQKEKLFFIVIALALIVVSFLLFILYNNKKRTGKILQEKNKQLKKLNYTKDKFISILAHDLKNPFAGFVRITDALKNNYKNIDNSKKIKYIETINNSAKNLNYLLNNMLRWAVIQNDKADINLSEIKLSEILTETKNILSDFAQQNNTKILIQIPENTIVLADKSFIIILLNNLITNAIKFSDKNKPVFVSAKKNNKFVQISIKDNGIGIAQKDIKKLFSLDENPKKIGNHKNKGTGMGLILCKEITEKMNGKIWVESEPGKGSEFIFTLPVA